MGSRHRTPPLHDVQVSVKAGRLQHAIATVLESSRLALAMVNLDPGCDTSRAAAEAQLEMLRRMGPGGRLRAGLRFSRSVIALSRAALRARNPDLDERTLQLLWIEQNYGAALAREVERHEEAVGWTSAMSFSRP